MADETVHRTTRRRSTSAGATRTHLRSWRGELGSSRQQIALVAILFVAIALRLVWVDKTMQPPRFLTDPSNYLLNGQLIAQGHGYRSTAVFWENFVRAFHGQPGQPLPYTAFYPPGYAFTLGGLFWVTMHLSVSEADLFRVAVYFNVLLGAATVVVLFEIMRRLFDVRVALVASGTLAIYPNLIFQTAVIGYETTFNFLVMALVLLIVATPWPEGQVRTRRLVEIGVLLAVATYVRPTVMFFVPALAVAWHLAGASWSRALRQCAVMAVIVTALLVPWTIRNVVRMNSPIILSSGIGQALCASRHPGAHGRYSPTTSRRYCDPDLRGVPAAKQEVLTANQNMHRAIAFILDHPVSEVNQWFWRTAASYGQDHDGLDNVRPPAVEWLEVLRSVADGFYFAVLALGLLGARAFATRAAPRRAFVLIAAASFAVVPLMLYGDTRYKIPLLPLLIGSAAVALVGAQDGIKAAARQPKEDYAQAR